MNGITYTDMSDWDDVPTVEVKHPTKVRTYTVTATITVEEHLDSSWHKPFTEIEARRLVAEISPEKRWFVTGGAYTAKVTKVSTRRISTLTTTTTTKEISA